jgi:hypothetical protein
MKLPVNTASKLQGFLYLTSLDDYCPDQLAGGRTDVRPDNAYELWRDSVELIYRCLACDLLKISMGWNKADPKGLSKALAQHDPFDLEDFNEHGHYYWIAPHFYATEKTKALLTKYKIDLDADVNESFTNAIAEIFDENGVSWGKNIMMEHEC